jgi:hypothetical protein
VERLNITLKELQSQKCDQAALKKAMNESRIRENRLY